MISWIYRDLVEFVRLLRMAGLPIGVEQTELFAQGLSCVEALSRREIYLVARATLVLSRDHLPVFDERFAAFFGEGDSAGQGQRVPPAPRHDRLPPLRNALTAFMAERARPQAAEVGVPEQTKAASSLEQLQRKDFSECTSEELEAIERALRDVRFDLTLRRSLRFAPSRHGESLDLRRMVRDAARHGGRALTLHRRGRKLTHRPLVVLADISGSMELYSRILLQFLHVISRSHRQAQTFVFGTRLTSITGQLQIRDVDTALSHAARAIVDFAGGTRIGECIGAFNRRYARRVLRKGAVLLFISDGWETGDASTLDLEMRRLRARCHRVVWLNPLMGRTGYEPRARGVEIALTHADDFLPAHNLQSLHELSWHLARIPRRKGSRPALVKVDR